MINDSKLNINTNQKLLNEIFDLVKDANEKKKIQTFAQENDITFST